MDEARLIPVEGPTGPVRLQGHGKENWPDINISGNKVFWKWITDSSVEDWGFIARVVGEAYGLGDTTQACVDILEDSGGETLLVMASGGPELSRISACRALRQILSNSKVLKVFTSTIGSAESLITLMCALRYEVIAPNGVKAFTSMVDFDADEVDASHKFIRVPKNTILVVDRKYTASKEVYLHISSPPEYADLIICVGDVFGEPSIQEVYLEQETLQLLGLLSLGKNFRSEVLQRGKMRSLLQLLRVDYAPCHRAVALALEEIAGDSYEWIRASSAFEIVFEASNEVTEMYSTANLERMPCFEFKTSLPSCYEERIEPGMVVLKSNESHYMSAEVSTQDIGIVQKVELSVITVEWGTGENKSIQHIDTNNQSVRVLRSKTNSILTYGSSGMHILIDKNTALMTDVTMQIRDSENSSRSLLEANDRTPIAGVLLTSRSRQLFVEINGRLPETILQSTLVLHVSPHRKLHSQEEPSYENDAFVALLSMLKSSDVQTKVSALAAVGKLAQYHSESSDVLVAFDYRARVLNDDAIFDLIEGTRDLSSGLIASEAWGALRRILPNMQCVLELLEFIHSRSLDPAKVARYLTFIGAYIFSLVYSRQRPHFQQKDFQPVLISTLVKCNDPDNFPNGCYASMDNQAHKKYDATFPGAVGLSISFHPLSRINSYPPVLSGEQKDVLIVRPPGNKIYQNDIADFVQQNKSVVIDHVDSIELEFKYELGSKFESSANAPGFSATIVAEYPNFEEVHELSPDTGYVSESMTRIMFYMADSIEILWCRESFIREETLTFYKEGIDGLEIIAVIDSLNSGQKTRITTKGDRIFYSLKLSSSSDQYLVKFHARPVFVPISKSENDMIRNIKCILPNQQIGSKKDKSGGLHHLISLIHYDDPTVNLWAALAYAQISLVNSTSDIYAGRLGMKLKSELENEASKPEEDLSFDDGAAPVDILYRQGAGISEASQLANNSNPTIRKQGCLALSRFVNCKGALANMVSDTGWRTLLRVCEHTYKSSSTVDIESCRYATWIISQLSAESENLEKMALEGAFEPLIMCLSTKDRLIKYYAADALFNLARNATNRKQLVNIGLDFLVDTATSAVLVSNRLKISDRERDTIALQQGAATVLCKLITAGDFGNFILAVENRAVEGLLLMLQEVLLQLSHVGATAIDQKVVDTCILYRQILDSFAAKLAENSVRELMFKQSKCWEDTFVVMSSIIRVWSANEHISSLLPNVSNRLIESMFALLVSEHCLALPIVRSLINIAGSLWYSKGPYIFERLAQGNLDDFKWMHRYFMKSALEYKNCCLLPSISILLSTDIAGGSSVILDYIRCSNVLKSCSGDEDQMYQISQLFFNANKRSKRKSKSSQTSNSSGLLSYHFDGVLKIASPESSQMELEFFYKYELRIDVLNFLESSFRLWDWLVVNKNQEACEKFIQFLPFSQLMSCLMWPYQQNFCNLTPYCDVFCNLMLHLYVCNVDMTGDIYNTAVKIGNKYSGAAPLSEEDKWELKLFVNEFLESGKRFTQVRPRDSKDLKWVSTVTLVKLAEKPDMATPSDIKRALSILDLLKGMIVTGYYDDPSDFQYMRDALLKYLATANGSKVLGSSKSTKSVKGQESTRRGKLDGKKQKPVVASSSSGTRSLKAAILQLLELCLDLDLSIQLSEYDKLKQQVNEDHMAGKRTVAKSGNKVKFHKELKEMLWVNIAHNLPLSENVPCVGMRVSTCKSRIRFWQSQQSVLPREGIITAINEDGTIHVKWDNYFFSDYDRNISKSTLFDPSLLSDLFWIRYPRLQSVINGTHAVCHDYSPSKIALDMTYTLGEQLVGSAMKFFILTHNSLDYFHSSIESLSIQVSNEGDKSFVALLRRDIASLQSVVLDETMATNVALKQKYERMIHRIRFALEGRTEGVTPSRNMFLTYGPDWRAERSQDSLFRVEKVKPADGNYGLQVIAVHLATSIERTFLFGPKHVFELALPCQDSDVYRRRQRIVSNAGIMECILNILMQEEEQYTMSEGLGPDSFGGIYAACCELLSSCASNNTHNTRKIASATGTYALAGHLDGRYGARKLLDLAASFGMFNTVAPKLLRRLAESVQHCIVNDDVNEAITTLQIFNNMLPSHSEKTRLDELQKRNLLLTQTIILNTLVAEISTIVPLLKRIVSTEFSSDAEVDEGSNEEYSMSNLLPVLVNPFSVTLIGVIAKCLHENPKLIFNMKSDFPSLGHSRLINVFRAMSDYIFGYKARAKILLPWLELLTSLCDFDNSEDRNHLYETLSRDIDTYFYSGDGIDSSVMTIESQHPYKCESTLKIYRVMLHSTDYMKIWFTAQSELADPSNAGGYDYVEILPALDLNPDVCQYIRVCAARGFEAASVASVKNHGFGFGGLFSALNNTDNGKRDYDTTPADKKEVGLHIPFDTLLTVNGLQWVETGDERGCGNYFGTIVEPSEYRGVMILLVHEALELCDANGRKRIKTISPCRYKGSSFPILNCELYAAIKEFMIVFRTHGHSPKWGWKLLAKSLTFDEYTRHNGYIPCNLFEQCVGIPGARVYEKNASLHDGKDYELLRIDFSDVDGARDDFDGLQVVFEEGTRTDIAVSYGTFFKDQNCNEFYGEQRYGGRREESNWPGIGSNAPLFIPSKCFYFFFSHKAAADIEYRFVVFPAKHPPVGYEKLCKQKQSVIKESEHFDLSTLETNQTVNMQFELATTEKIVEVSDLNGIIELDYIVPVGSHINVVAARAIDGEIYCKIKPQSLAVMQYPTHAPQWSRQLSFDNLRFYDEYSVHRRDNVRMPNPACLCAVDSVHWQLSVESACGLESQVGFSFGIASHSFPKCKSKGFGLQQQSWGIVCQQRSRLEGSYVAVFDCGQRIGSELSPLDDGDVLTLQFNKIESWADVVVVYKKTKCVRRHRFQLPQEDGSMDYVAGATLSMHQTLNIVRHEWDLPVDDRDGDHRISVQRGRKLDMYGHNMWLPASALCNAVPEVIDSVVTIGNHGLVLIFDPIMQLNALGSGNCLEIFANSAMLSSSRVFSSTNGYWPHDDDSAIKINASTIYIRHSRLQPFSFGYRFAVMPAKIPVDPFLIYSRDQTKFKILSSSRNLLLKKESQKMKVTISGAYGLIVIFERQSAILGKDNYIEFLKYYDGDGVWTGGPDNNISRFRGDNNGPKKAFPGVGDMPPLRISSDTFWFHFKCQSVEPGGWRAIVFDQSLVDLQDMETPSDEGSVISNIPTRSDMRYGSNLFYFFENHTNQVQSVKIDMPIRSGVAYFEVQFGTSSTVSSYSQIGCIVADDELLIEHNPPMTLSNEVSNCLGIGSVIGSYALGGVTDPTINSYRYCKGPMSGRPFEKIDFSDGSVIGVLLDLNEGKVYYFSGGQNKGVAFTKDLDISWKSHGGLCPAFSFCPGQSLSVNVGQFQFREYSEVFESVLSKYDGAASGDAFFWNSHSLKWNKVNHKSGILEDVLCPEGQAYAHEVGHFLQNRAAIEDIPRDHSSAWNISNQQHVHPNDSYNIHSLVKSQEFQMKVSRTHDWKEGKRNRQKHILPTFLALETWEASLSNPVVEFSSDLKTACHRGSKAFSFAYVVPMKEQCFMTITIGKDSEENEVMSASSSADIGISLIHTDFLNESKHTITAMSKKAWGLMNSGTSSAEPVIAFAAGETVGSCRAFKCGDKISCAFDIDSGIVAFALNNTEYCKDMAIPSEGSYLIAVSLVHNFSVSIITDHPRHLLKVMDELRVKANESASKTELLHDRDMNHSMRLILKGTSAERLRALKVNYHDSERALKATSAALTTLSVERLEYENSITIPEMEHIEQKSWLVLPPEHLPLATVQQLQDMAVAEIFNERYLLECWFKVVEKRGGKPLSSDNKAKKSGIGDAKIHTEVSASTDTKWNIQDYSVPLRAIISAAMTEDAIISKSGFAMLVVRLLKSMALAIPKNYARDTSKVRVRRKINSEASDDYSDPDHAATLLIVQSCLADLGAVKLCCFILAQKYCSLELQHATLNVANFMLINVINQQEGKEDANIQRMFLDVMLGEGTETGNKPIAVASTIGYRLHTLQREISAFRGTEQKRELYIAEQTLLFLQRSCGK